MTDTGFNPVQPLHDADTLAEMVPPEEVVAVDGAEASAEPPPEDNTAASAPEVPPAVIAPNPEADQQWNNAFPGFAGQRESTPADMQAQMWRNKALLATTQADSVKDEGPGRPTVTPLPRLDPKAATERFKQAVIDNDMDAQMQAQSEIVDFVQGAVVTVNDYGLCNEYDINQIRGELNEVRLPETIRAAGVNIPGFQETDVVQALTYVRSGQVPDPALAVGYAIAARLVASNSAAPPSAAEVAARQVKAQLAASTPDGSPAAPRKPFEGSPSFQSPEFKAAFEAVYRAALAAEK